MVSSSWLTAGRVRRLLVVLSAVPARAPGLPIAEARLRMWRSCGGPIDEVPQLLDLLVGADLLSADRGHYRPTPAGQRAVSRARTEGLRPVATALLRAGYLHDQVRILLELLVLADDGSLIGSPRQARNACPQLIGILAQWPGVVGRDALRIPGALVDELQAVWALLPPTTADDREGDAIRKSIGNRGELYSYQMLRLEADVGANIVWVARDDETLGYDIEDRSLDPHRRIEVKASGETTTRFLVSENEWRKAHEDPDRYEVHFWGGIDLAMNPADEFRRLRDWGYPIVLVNLPELVARGDLDAVPVKWRISQINSESPLPRA